MRARYLLPFALNLASATALGGYLILMYKAGCAGDLKSGTSGDTQKALLFESYGLPCMLLLMLLAAVSAFVRKKNGTTKRLAFAVFVFLVIGALALLAGIQVELFGNRACVETAI